MLFLIAFVAGAALGRITGGRLSNLARLNFRWPWVVVAAATVRVAVVLPPLSRFDGSRYVYVLALAVIVAWAFWHVDRLPGVWLVGLGAALNVLVIVANRARMPVSPEFAGSLLRRGEFAQYVVMGSNTNLNLLGDWIKLYPSPEVYSVGDIVVALGLAIVVFISTATPARIVR